jgi:MFS family permease
MLKPPHINLYGRGRPLRIAITICCQLAFVLFGYDQGVFSGIVGNANFLDTFGHPSPGLEGIIVAIYNLGCFAGCGAAFAYCEVTGRKWAMWIAMGFIIVSFGVGEVGGVLLSNIGRRRAANMRVFGSAYYGCAVHYGDRNGYRDVDCADVSE